MQRNEHIVSFYIYTYLSKRKKRIVIDIKIKRTKIP